MKKLNKKIGVGVLVAGLVMGGLGLFGGSVAHADSASVKVKEEVDEELLGLEFVDEKEIDRLLEEMFKEASVKKENVDGRDIYKVSLKNLNL